MTDKILYRVLFDENEEVARIFFEIKETNEIIEGAHQIQKWANNLFEENKKLKSENEELKKVLGAILFEIKRDINVFNTKQAGEIKVFIHPNSFDLISEVLRKYGA